MASPSDTKSKPATSPVSRLLQVGGGHRDSPAAPPRSSRGAFTYPMRSPSLALRPRSVICETAHGYSPVIPPPAPPPPHVGPSPSSTTPAAPPCSSHGPSTHPAPSPSLRLPARTFGRHSPHRDGMLPDYDYAELFAASDNGMVDLIARLSRKPAPAPEGDYTEHHDEVGSWSSETKGDLFLVFFDNGNVKSIASLTFTEGHLVTDESSESDNSWKLEGSDDSSLDQKVGQLEGTDEELDDVSTGAAKEDSDDGKPWFLGHGMWPEQDEVSGDKSEDESNHDEESENESDEEQERDKSSQDAESLDGSSEEEDGSDEGDSGEDQEESDDEKHYHMELRMWPTRANLILFDTSSWLFSKAYCLQWLSAEHIDTLVQTIKESGYDIALDGSSILHQLPTGRCTFEGPMISSRDVENFVERNLSPSLLDFHIKKLLGFGATSNVRLCTYNFDGNDYALKIIPLTNDDQIPSEPREVTILSYLRHDFVVKFTQAWVESDSSGYVCYEKPESSSNESLTEINSGHEPTKPECSNYLLIQMEYCPRSLEKYLSLFRKVDAQESCEFFEKITKGVKYIHKEGVIHRDLKPGNVFLGINDVVKIGDFGQSCFGPNDCIFFKPSPNLGTLFYGAPELLRGELISEKVDVHPLGIMYFELYNSFNTMGQKQRDLDGLRKSCSNANLSGKGDPLLCLQMIAEDPLTRPSPNDILESIAKHKALV